MPPDIYWAPNGPKTPPWIVINPLGEHERGHRGFTQGGDLEEDGGNRNQFRVDVADAELPRTDNIYHSTSSLSSDSDNGLITFFSDFQVMEKNAQLLSTRDKIRTGTIGRVASPGDDLISGGGNFSYLRVQRDESDTWAGLYFKPRNLRRLDAVHYRLDSFGRMTEDFPEQNRRVGRS